MSEADWHKDEAVIEKSLNTIPFYEEAYSTRVFECAVEVFYYVHEKYLLDPSSSGFSFPIINLCFIINNFVDKKVYNQRLLNRNFDLYILENCIASNKFLRELVKEDPKGKIIQYGNFRFRKFKIKLFWLRIVTGILVDRKDLFGRYTSTELYDRLCLVQNAIESSTEILHVNTYFYISEIMLYFKKSPVRLSDPIVDTILLNIKIISKMVHIAAFETIETICKFIATCALIDEKYDSLARMSDKLMDLYLETDMCKNLYVLKCLSNLSSRKPFIQYIDFEVFMKKLERMSLAGTDRMTEYFLRTQYNLFKANIESLND